MPGYKVAVSVLAAGLLLASPADAALVLCLCDHGQGVNTVSCPDDNETSKQDCEFCETENGYRIVGKLCERCNDGMWLDTSVIPEGQCKECESLNKVVDAKQTACSHQVCTCGAGEPLKDQECTTAVTGSSKEFCKSCASGYKMKSNAERQCVKSEDGTNLHVHQVHQVECGANEKPNSDHTKCNKVCTCKHGRAYEHEKCTAAVGAYTNSVLQEYCEQCSPGYSLSSDNTSCTAQEKCHCDNGTPVAGALCSEYGGGMHMCETCNSGYGWGGWPNAAGMCVLQESPFCTCTHGIGATGEFCTKMGRGEVCVSCTAPGKVLTWDAKCKDKTEIKCTCQGGSVVDDVSCLMRGGGEACKACGGGFGDKNQMPYENGSCMNKEEFTASYAPEELRIVYAVNNLDYAVLSADKIVRAKVELAAKQALVALIGAEMTPDEIEVTLSSGSTIVNAKLTMPTNSAGRNLAHQVRQPAFNSHIAQLLGQINGLKLTDKKTPQVGTVQIQMTPKKLPHGAVTRPVQRPPSVGMLYSVEPAQTTRTTNSPLIGSVAAAFFAGGFFVARALPAARGWTSREQGLVELEQASPVTH